MLRKNENYYGEPDYAVAPGSLILESLDSLGMTQRELGIRLGLTPKTINGIIKGRAPVPPRLAEALASVLGASAVFWLNMEAQYRADLIRIKNKTIKQPDSEKKIASLLPYNEMVQKNWVPPTRKCDERVLNLRGFFRVASLENIEKLGMAANFRARTNGSPMYAQLAWLQQGENLASQMTVGSFSLQKLKDSLPLLRQLTLHDADKCVFDRMREICADCGVSLVFLPHLKGTGICGAMLWLKQERPLIILSAHGKRHDIFWFTFFHELGHILLRHQKKSLFVSFERDGKDFTPENAKQEGEADIFAQDVLISAEDWRSLIASTLTDEDILDFAEKIKIHRGIVFGRMAKEGFRSWSKVENFRVKIEIQ